MSRRKEILESQFVDGEWEELMSNLNTDISPSVYLAMEKYARECCEATLEEASDWFIDSDKKVIKNEGNIKLL